MTVHTVYVHQKFGDRVAIGTKEQAQCWIRLDDVRSYKEIGDGRAEIDIPEDIAKQRGLG